MFEPALVEGVADRGDAAIHHVGGRDDVGPGGRVRNRRPHELLDGRIVGDLIVDEDPAVAVIGVFAQADVGDDQHLRQLALERPDRRLHGRLRIVSGRPDVVLLIRQPEEQHAPDAVRPRRPRLCHRLVDREVEDAGHRADLPAHAFTGADEQREHQRVGRETGFADERPHGVGSAEPAKPACQLQRGVRMDGVHVFLERCSTIAFTSAGIVCSAGMMVV